MAQDGNEHMEEVYSSKLKAGKRTYFIDVKETRNGEYYLTLSEHLNKKGRDGKPVTLRHRIFLYKEEFDAFSTELQAAIGFTREKLGEDYGKEGRTYHNPSSQETPAPSSPPKDDNADDGTYRADVRFEDL